jgi:nucleotide-binding universal stress UspA family protein
MLRKKDRELQMHVMIAIDGTEAAATAAQVALDMYGDAVDYTVVSIGSIAPVHSVTPFITPPTLMHLTHAADDEGFDPWARSEALTDELVDRLDAPSIETVVEVGSPGHALCELAGDRDVDVLVLGAHDRGFLSRLLEPSVARHAIEHAPCHVLVVRGSG